LRWRRALFDNAYPNLSFFMTHSNLQITRDPSGVLRMTLDRPDVLNAFDEALIAAITEAFQAVHADPAVRVVVLASAGRMFCAGADVGWLRRAAANDQAANLEDARRFAAMMDAIDRCPQPVVARIQGPAYGGGVGLACAADIAIASERARFSVSEAKLGILPAVIGPYLINAVGLRQARRLALTCTSVSAQEALTMGLVPQVASENELDQAVQTCIDELLIGGPQAQRAIKRLFSRLHVGPVTDEVQELTAQAISQTRAGAEAGAGFEAFFAKRSAPWVPKP
jgi:methylglutaconyl-CoA hydratase